MRKKPEPAPRPAPERSVFGAGPSQLPEGELFSSMEPESGLPLPHWFAGATDAEVDQACVSAWEAFHGFRETAPAARAKALRRIAIVLDGLDRAFLDAASKETGLGVVRLASERERAAETLRMVADTLDRGDWCRPVIDLAEHTRRPLPRPDIRRIDRALGPVALMGPATSPIAWGPVGADAASALGAGCPVIFKAHPDHPWTDLAMTRAARQGLADAGLDPACVSLVLSAPARAEQVASRLASHPCVRAVGLCGSVSSAESLERAISRRADRIPLFATCGTLNPVFVLQGAAQSGARDIGQAIASAALNCNGQHCARPGVVFAARGAATEVMAQALADAVSVTKPEPLAGPTVHARFLERVAAVREVKDVELRAGTWPKTPASSPAMVASGVLLRTRFEHFKAHPVLHEENHGPMLLLVICDTEVQLLEAAARLRSALTASIWAAESDGPMLRRLQGILEHRVGRLAFGCAPAGVEISPAMVHAGPYPASTRPDVQSLGTGSISRWTRPVCFQDAPDSQLPMELRNGNPMRLERLVNGVRTRDPIVPHARRAAS